MTVEFSHRSCVFAGGKKLAAFLAFLTLLFSAFLCDLSACFS